MRTTFLCLESVAPWQFEIFGQLTQMEAKVNSDFDVFDEWGNFVGKFTPTGGSGLDGCFFAIAVLIAGTIGFVAYLITKLVVACISEGFEAAKNGKWISALLLWAVPILPVFFVCLFGLAMLGQAVVTVALDKAEEKAKAELATAEYSRLREELDSILMSDISYKRCVDDPEGGRRNWMCPGYESVYKDDRWVETVFAVFQVQNESETSVLIHVAGYSDGMDVTGCSVSNWVYLPLTSLEIWCFDGSFLYGKKGHRPEPPKQICVDIRLELSEESRKKLGDKDSPTLRICRPVSFR